MTKINTTLRYVTILLLVSPILGVLGVFPEPTADLYNNAKAFDFIKTLSDVGYINWIIAVVFAFCIYLLVTKRTALAALLLLPITINIIAFHLFLDGGIFTLGAIMGNVLFLLNLYFLWRNWTSYKILTQKDTLY